MIREMIQAGIKVKAKMKIETLLEREDENCDKNS